MVILIAEAVVAHESPRCRTPALLHIVVLRSSASSSPAWRAPDEEVPKLDGPQGSRNGTSTYIQRQPVINRPAAKMEWRRAKEGREKEWMASIFKYSKGTKITNVLFLTSSA